MQKHALLILKASAGSGKTYALVQEYLRIVLHAESLDAFSRIMAMTFTNKAALEMKDRVIQGLVDLAFGGEEKASFLHKTAENIELNPAEVQARSKKVIKRILHNYSELSIQTIDKFNIRLIRTFTRDLDLPGDFEIVLDSRELIEKTIDTLIDSIGEKGKEELSAMLVDFARANSEEEQSWDFRNLLIDFTRLAERESNIPVIAKVNELEFNKEEYENLSKQVKSIESAYDQRKGELIQFIHHKGWTKNNFKYNTRLYDRLALLPQTQLSTLNLLTETMLKGLQKIIHEGHEYLTPEFATLTLDFYTWAANNLERYMAFNAARKSFYQLALLRYINISLKDIRSRENLVQIADINSLIAGLIQSESAPFIYERIGNRYDNYLLDEFQDTSRLQWLNLIPLLHESMSHGNRNLIVGDTKQAIYRFRNGLVEQFAALPDIYNPEGYAELERKSRFFREMSFSDKLKQNWRSKQEIVSFNNELFREFGEVLPEKYQTYYDYESLKQEPKGGVGGFIYAEAFQPSKDNPLDENHDLIFLDKAISECIADGYSPGDICLLARNSKECSRWANHLMEKGFYVLSDEGMKVKQSPNVRLLVAYIKLRQKPYNREYQTLFTETYCGLYTPNPFVHFSEFVQQGVLNFDAFVMATFGSKDALFMRYENLYDLAQLFMRLIELNELSDPYLHYFCNMLLQFDLTKGPNLGDFVKYFEEKGYKENVPLPERNDAITIMTAHKSKGLEFTIVILADLMWSFGIHSSEKAIIDDHYHNLMYIAKPSKNGTLRQNEEHTIMIEANLLDATNLFYVACTRAVDRLYLNASGARHVTQLDGTIRDLLAKLTIWDEQKEGVYYFGSRTFTPHSREPKALFQPVSDQRRLWFPDISLIDQDTLEDIKISKEAKFGKLLHHAMEQMNAPSEMNRVVDEMVAEKRILGEEKVELEQTLVKLLQNQTVTELIFPLATEEVLNEREIVVSESERIRPDRVIVSKHTARVIDFKTGIPRARDEKQIKNYAQALVEIGFEKCTAWLVYTDTLQIKQVG